MSHEALTWATRQKTGSAPTNFVLFVLANYADQEWSCFPSVAAIAEITELSERAVRRAVADLHASGKIRILYRYRSNGSRRSSRYQLLYEGGGTPLPETDDWTSEKPYPDTQSGGGYPDTQSGVSGHQDRRGVPQGPDISTSKDTSLDPPLTGGGKPRQQRATRVPDDFRPDEKMRAWFAAEKLGQLVDGRIEHEKFMDYWRAEAGMKAQKVDWPATWRRWMRTAAERAQRDLNRAGVPTGFRVGPARSTTDERVAQGLRLAEMFDRKNGKIPNVPEIGGGFHG